MDEGQKYNGNTLHLNPPTDNAHYIRVSRKKLYMFCGLLIYKSCNPLYAVRYASNHTWSQTHLRKLKRHASSARHMLLICEVRNSHVYEL